MVAFLHFRPILAILPPFYIINSKTALEFPLKFSIFGRNIQ